MKNANRLLLPVLLTICVSVARAQQKDTLEIQRNKNGHIVFGRFKPDGNRKAEDAALFLHHVLPLKPGDELRLINRTTDRLGFTHHLFQQYYKGIKVENAEYHTHGRNGIVETINGDFQAPGLSSVAPSLNEQQALEAALRHVHARKYKWQDPAMESFIRQHSGNPLATYYPKGELVVTRDLLKGGERSVLAWKFTISSLDPNDEQWVYVDAASGEVVRTTPRISDGNTPCTAGTRYVGTQTITGDSYAGGYRLQENRNGVTMQTLNLQYTQNYGSAIDFSNSSTSFTYNTWPNYWYNYWALDAHWGAESVLDYWSSVHGRNSIDGNGMAMISYVHNSIGSNAYWDGTANVMNYGDGDGALIGALTTIDVCGHEMGHGITQYTAGLTPGYQESGALNEGFSDIWAACITHRAAPSKPLWLLAHDIFLTNGYDCIRNMQNPKSTTAYEGRHPDTYHGTYWDTYGEPHNNSTVLSHWFYLLTAGGSGTNDISNAYAVGGIGIDEAQLIAFRAESVYLTSSADYAAARTATIQAARDLYGVGACEEISTTNAWYAVGVGGPYQFAINGDDKICGYNGTVSGTYSIPNLPAGSGVHWSASPSNLVSINSPNSPTTTINKLDNGWIVLTATITAPCGTFTVQKTPIYVLSPYSSAITGWDNVVLTASEQYLFVSWLPTANYEWSVYSSPDPYSYSFDPGGGNMVDFYAWMPGYYGLQVQVTTACGVYYAYGGAEVYDRYNYMFTVAPNPVSTMLSITQSTTGKAAKAKTATAAQPPADITAVRIYDASGNVKKEIRYGAGTRQLQVNVGDLKTGVYTVEISTANKKERQQIIIQNK